MRIYAFALVALVGSATAYAQTGEIPANELRRLANDLEGIQQLLLKAQKQQFVAASNPSLPPRPWTYPASVKVTGKFAYANAGASEKTARVAALSSGQSYSVIDKASGWYAIELPSSTVGGSKYGWVSAADVVPEASGIEPTRSTSQDIYDEIIRRISDVKKKYDDNRYLRVTGFSVQLPWPSVSVSFEFK